MYRVRCDIVPPSVLGHFSDSVVVMPQVYNGSPLPPLRIPVEANVVGDVVATPSTLFLKQGATDPHTVVLASRGANGFVLSEVRIGDPRAISARLVECTPDRLEYELLAQSPFSDTDVMFVIESLPQAAGKQEVIVRCLKIE